MGLVLMAPVLSKSLIQFSVDGWGCVASLLFSSVQSSRSVMSDSLRELFSVIYRGPNYGGGNEDNGDLFQKIPCMYCYTQCPQPCSRPLATHASAGDSWTLTGKSGSVSCEVTAETESELCLSISCGGMGHQWSATGTGALGAADLGMA